MGSIKWGQNVKNKKGVSDRFENGVTECGRTVPAHNRHVFLGSGPPPGKTKKVEDRTEDFSGFGQSYQLGDGS